MYGKPFQINFKFWNYILKNLAWCSTALLFLLLRQVYRYTCWASPSPHSSAHENKDLAAFIRLCRWWVFITNENTGAKLDFEEQNGLAFYLNRQVTIFICPCYLSMPRKSNFFFLTELLALTFLLTQLNIQSLLVPCIGLKPRAVIHLYILLH